MEVASSCPVCYEPFSAAPPHQFIPKVLPCGHTICVGCAERIVKRSKGKVKCPLDMREFVVVASVEDELPTNNEMLKNIANEETTASAAAKGRTLDPDDVVICKDHSKVCM